MHGRHDLPWRATAEPWAILVSEVMLQQTQVARVSGRWEAFLARWPTPEACAAAPLAAVLREWQGLGYPRRARALHDTARSVAAGMARHRVRLAIASRRRPVHGESTAGPGVRSVDGSAAGRQHRQGHGQGGARQRAGRGSANRHRRAACDGATRGMSARAFTYALFDTGALHCRARPRCQGCPLAATCASRSRLVAAPPGPRRHSPRYHGSARELRGAVLRAMLAEPRPRTIAELQTRAGAPAAGLPSTDIALVLDALVHEGLVDPTPRMVRIN